MWKHCFFLIFLCFVTLANLLGQAPSEKMAGKEKVLQAIKSFRQDPSGIQGQAAKHPIFEFATNSADVEVLVGPKLLLWVADGTLTSEQHSVLIAAYCAGAIDSQLSGGQARSTALVAACEQVFATYRQLQTKQPDLRATGVEKLLELQRQHKLTGYLEAAEKEIPRETRGEATL